MPANGDYTTEELEAFAAGWDTECFILGNQEAQYTLLGNALIPTQGGVGISELEMFAAGCDAAADVASDDEMSDDPADHMPDEDDFADEWDVSDEGDPYDY